MKQLDFINFAKGIGIFLVIAGHVSEPGSSIIYGFHMPLFFFISGYLFTEKKSKEIILSKFNRLYIPYLFFFLISWLFFTSVIYFKGDPQKTSEQFNSISNILIGEKVNGGNVPIWFLVSLFFLNVFYNYLLKAFRNIILLSAVIIALSVIGFLLVKSDVFLPFEIVQSLIAVPFIHLGYLLRKYNALEWIEDQNQIKFYSILILFIILFLIFCPLNNKVSGFHNVNVAVKIVGNYYYYYLAGITGTLAFLMICTKFRFQKIVNFYGLNSLVILGVHDVFAIFITKNIKHQFSLQSPFVVVVISLIVLLICTGLIFLSKKFIPSLTGYKNLITISSSE